MSDLFKNFSGSTKRRGRAANCQLPIANRRLTLAHRLLPIAHRRPSFTARPSPLAPCHFQQSFGQFLFLVWWIVLPVIGAQAEETGWLRLNTHREGLQVFVNDSLIGTTPFDSIRFGKGAYTLRVHDPKSRVWLGGDWIHEILIRADSLTSVDPGAPESLWIDSDPSQADVSAGNSCLGRTPLKLDAAFVGDRNILIGKKGYKTKNIILTRFSGQPIRVTLEQEPPDFFLQPVLADGAGVFRSPPVLVTGTVALLTGVAGYVLKSMAEKSYRRYQSASDPEDMNRHFKRAVHYDQISGACYVTCEIHLCAAMVFSIRGAER